ncbi:hypothetical protein [Rhizobium leguminosarum]|uniref:hypothetical protein n=1 Tax=Rhizobium leguminosarum TaxID=384 RepID=UPI00048939DB|nr:hypothetical protein [Rhizobium leguminosarum]
MIMRNEVVAAINAALTSDDRVLLIEQEIMNGCTLQEIEQAFVGSKWRFHLHKSGLRIAIADIDQLHQSYKNSLDELRAMCSGLRIQDKTISKPWHALEQIRVRTEVARQARKITLVEARANRFLSHRQRLGADGGDQIAALLQGFGFEWTGADIVLELDQGEHPATREFTRDRHVTEISTGPLAEKGDHAQKLSDLRQATNGDSGDDVAVNLNRALHAVPLRDIADVLKDTDLPLRISSRMD